MLRSIAGEPAVEEDELPAEPHPRWGPESVVRAQLAALRCRLSSRSGFLPSQQPECLGQPWNLLCLYREGNVERVASFTAPKHTAGAAVAPESLLGSPCYGPLLHHAGFEMVATAQASSHSAYIFVGAQCGPSQPSPVCLPLSHTPAGVARYHKPLSCAGVNTGAESPQGRGGKGAREAENAGYMLPYMWSLSLHCGGTTWLVDSVLPVTGA